MSEILKYYGGSEGDRTPVQKQANDGVYMLSRTDEFHRGIVQFPKLCQTEILCSKYARSNRIPKLSWGLTSHKLYR